MVSTLSSGRSERPPMTHRLMVYSPVMVMMPAKMACTFMRVCRKAVTNPAAMPASIPAKSPSTGCPWVAQVADTAHPNTNEPSVVRSAMSRMRYDR